MWRFECLMHLGLEGPIGAVKGTCSCMMWRPWPIVGSVRPAQQPSPITEAEET